MLKIIKRQFFYLLPSRYFSGTLRFDLKNELKMIVHLGNKESLFPSTPDPKHIFLVGFPSLFEYGVLLEDVGKIWPEAKDAVLSLKNLENQKQESIDQLFVLDSQTHGRLYMACFHFSYKKLKGLTEESVSLGTEESQKRALDFIVKSVPQTKGEKIRVKLSSFCGSMREKELLALFAGLKQKFEVYY